MSDGRRQANVHMLDSSWLSSSSGEDLVLKNFSKSCLVTANGICGNARILHDSAQVTTRRFVNLGSVCDPPRQRLLMSCCFFMLVEAWVP